MPLFGPDPLDILILKEVKQVHDLCRVGFDTLAEAAERNLRCCQKQGARLDELEDKLNIALAILLEIRAIVTPKLTSLVILFDGEVMPANIAVGQVTVATVLGFDQNNQPFPIDFAANPPAWSIDNPAVASIAPDSTTPSSEAVTGVSAGSATLSVSCAGLSASDTVTVSAAAPVLTTLQIQFA